MRSLRDRIADWLFLQHEKRFEKMCEYDDKYRDSLHIRVLEDDVERIRTWGLGAEVEEACICNSAQYANRRAAKNGKQHLHGWYQWSAYWALAIWARIQIELAKIGI